MASQDEAQSLQRAFSLHRGGKLAEAAQLYRKVIKRNPKEANALHSLGIIEASAGNFAEAADLMARSVRVQAGNVQFIQNYATVLCQLGEFGKAGEVCLKGLALDDGNAYLLYVAAGALFKQRRLTEALSRFDALLRREPRHVAALAERSLVLAELKQFDAALADVDQAIALSSQFAEAHLNRGVILGQARRAHEAIASFDAALKLDPKLARAWLGRGNVLFDLNLNNEALAAYDLALAMAPDFAEAWLGRGNLLLKLERRDEALAAYERVLSLRPQSAEAWARYGTALAELDRLRESLAAYDKAVALDKGYAEAHVNRGVICIRMRRCDDAIASFDRALELDPALASAWHGRGNALLEANRRDEASTAYDRALSIAPDFAEAWLGRGNVCFEFLRLEEAATAYDRALALNPSLAEAWVGRGNIMFELQRNDEALAAYDRALSLRPQSAEAWTGRGNVCTALQRHYDALQAYEKAFALKPDLPALEGARLHAKMRMCEWTNLEAESGHLIQSVRLGKVIAEPFVLFSINSTAEDQLRCASSWVRTRYPPQKASERRSDRNLQDRIRLGYVSADFRQHPVAQLVSGVVESHQRTQFEVVGISIGPNDNSDMRRRLEGSFDRFVDCEPLDVDAIATRIRELEIDILVDLNGFTQHARPGIFARRPAPIQVNYLGYPGTTGASYFDYIMADRHVVPASHRDSFAEKLVYLPHSYLPHDEKGREISTRRLERREFGLPDQGFVFCCFNTAYKLNPRQFAARMKLLNKIDGSVLWLSGYEPRVVDNLRKEAAAAGVDPSRLVFANRVPLSSEHLARHRLADLFLDTLPYNAHTTASDALWAGLPVLTQLGETFAGRVAASLLAAIGLPELITETEAQFEALALELATNPDRLAAVTAKLAQNRLSQPLFDTPLYVSHLEQAFTAMFRRHRDGQEPDHIDLSR